MSDFLVILVVIFLIFGISFFLLNIKQIFTGKAFSGTCGSNNPMLRNKIGECTVCGKQADEDCKMPEKEG